MKETHLVNVNIGVDDMSDKPKEKEAGCFRKLIIINDQDDVYVIPLTVEACQLVSDQLRPSGLITPPPGTLP